MTNAETAAFFRNQADHYRDLGQMTVADDYKLSADAIEAVERLEAERAQWKRQVAVEELRRLAAEWGNRGRKRRMLAQELVDRADEIKARRESTNAAD